MRNRFAAGVMTLTLLGGCAIGSSYKRPDVPTAPAYVEDGTWRTAAPANADLTSKWWTLFGDEDLNALEERVLISNQNIAAAAAAYDQAAALARQATGDLFPTVSVNASQTNTQNGANARKLTRNSAALQADWEVDVWGRLRRQAEAQRNNARASADDLAAATLSVQAAVAINYVNLRAADESARLLDATVDSLRESLRVARNRYAVGVASRGDVASAESQLAAAQAEAADARRQRALLQHAIAVQVGQTPEAFALAGKPWTLTAPAVPVSVPSALLQRRPDIAAAERRMMAANAQIGVAQAAFFPSIALSGSAGGVSSAVGSLLSAPNQVWSWGVSLAGTVLDFGQRGAAVKGARAGFNQTVAEYRQTVLSAFQDVEDQLANSHAFGLEVGFRTTQEASANEAERIATNEYKAGTADITALVVAQNNAKTARINAIDAQANDIVASVNLIAALGGGWKNGS